MRILFAGSPDLAVPSLVAVHERYPVCGVLTNPDRPAGRSRHPEATAVKVKALELGLPVLQPRSFDEQLLEAAGKLDPELLVVVAFGTILRKDFLDLFPQQGINVHASLLPRFRGPAPIAAAILAGDRETGVTVQRLALKMDAGEILAVRKVPLTGRETRGSLSEVLAVVGADLLVSTLGALERGEVRPVAQDEGQATYCRLVSKEDGRVDWAQDARVIERMIRAYDPWPRAYTHYRGQRLNLLAGGVYPGSLDATGKEEGLVLAVDNRYGILVNTGRGVLFLTRLQLQARKPLDWRFFLNGQKEFIGSQLGDIE